MKKYIYLLALAVTALSLTSCGEDKQVEAYNAPTINVKVSQVKADDNHSFLSASGKIQARRSADLSTRIMGHVDQIHVSVGDEVRKGQLLVSINNSDLQAKRAQVNAGIIEATIAFNNAQKDYERFKNLMADNSASQKEMDDMTANFEMAKARLETANQMKNEINAQFAYSNIKAPFNGTITRKTIEIGDMTNPGVPLISMEAPGSFDVLAMVAETGISQIKPGTEVNVLVDAINRTLKGKVTELSTSAKDTGGQYQVKIGLDKTDAQILSGMFATVQFPLENQINTELVLVPTEAIITRGQLSGIYTVSQGNTAILRWLRLGRTFGDQVEVLSGLNTDEAYIVSAEGKLFNGVRVSIQ